MSNKKRLLFLCTGNSCRSQMAEGWGKELQSDNFEFYSAGIETHGLNPNAVEVMKKNGVDISTQESSHVDEFASIPMDYVVSVCDHAAENCPIFPATVKRIHKAFDDPPKLAKQETDPAKALEHYQRVCMEIKSFVENLPAHLSE